MSTNNPYTFTLNRSKKLSYYIGYNVDIVQSDHQTIYVQYNGKEYTTGFTGKKNSYFYAYVVPEEGYTPGALSTVSDHITEDMVISAEPASITTCTVTIVQVEHQTITVTCNREEYTETFEAPYGSQFRVNVTADEGYIAAKPNVSLGRVLNNMTITATGAPEQINYMITINQSEHQTITVMAGGRSYTSSVSLPYGTTYLVNIEAEPGFIAGTLNIKNGTLTAPVTISATPAVASTVRITIDQPRQYQVIHVYTGSGQTDHTSSFTCDAGTEYEIVVIPDMWWKAGELNIPASGTFTEDTTVTVGEPSIQTDYDADITIEGRNLNGNTGYGFNTNDGVGDVTPLYITDGLMIYPPGTSRSYFFFWGASSVKGLFTTMSCSMTYEDDAGEEQTIMICDNIPNSSFDGNGDIYDLPNWDREFYELMKSLDGKTVTLHLHIDVA